MIDYNRLSVVKNPYQKDFKRVLCVCSGGVLRSPTAALVLAMEPFNCNTRAVGTEDYALIKVDEALLQWSHEIVCMTETHAEKIKAAIEQFEILCGPVVVLGIPDNFEYRDSELVKMIGDRYAAYLEAK